MGKEFEVRIISGFREIIADNAKKWKNFSQMIAQKNARRISGGRFGDCQLWRLKSLMLPPKEVLSVMVFAASFRVYTYCSSGFEVM